ncbi:hypothetical protein BGX28_002451, partial [Mortierella sp. GBA30]
MRKVLKMQSTTRNHYAWTAQQRTTEYVREWQQIEWRSTLGIIHDNHLPGAFYTSEQDCRLRSHRFKKMHGMLPTLRYMRRWKPNLYNTDICRVCLRETEDLKHLWNCMATKQKRKQGWIDAIEAARSQGPIVTRRAHKKWKKKKEAAEKNGSQFKAKEPSRRVILT